MFGFGGFDLQFRLFSILFFIMFLVVTSVIVVSLVKGISQWNKNNNSPRLTVEAKVVAKRTNVSRHHHGTGADRHVSNSTSYYATFQFESGDRLELELRGTEYGLIVEGDGGRLTFQGTRYLGFERT